MSIKRTSEICLMVGNEIWVLLLGAKKEKLGIKLEKNLFFYQDFLGGDHFLFHSTTSNC